MKELISVIMSTYNEKEEWLKGSIESILNQTHSHLEFVIVLDNPNNLLIKRVVFEYAKKDERIIVIENDKNIGLTNSLNKALEYCNGEYIARMDADDVSDHHRLENQLYYLKQYNLDLVGSKIRRIDDIGSIIQESSNHPVSHHIINRVLKYDNCIPHPTWLVKKEVYVNLNGYRNLHTCEDYDFLLRCKKKFRIGNCHNVTLSYRLNPISISRSNALKQLLSANFLQKNFKNIELITQSKIDQYINKKTNIKAMENFDKAQIYFKKALICKEKNQLFKMVLNLIFAFTTSKYFFIKCKNMLAIRMIKLIER
ncbi:glycosyltransferase family 2 protein [Neobacillus sp. SAB-20_R2A]|uniref:glycosyltransferase family 2 protein n=1 Tax=Neobacillus sp. SAB-20_R2A TaxID=3120519 RepID=UPI003C6E990A